MRGSSSRNPTGPQPQVRIAHQLAGYEPSALAAADDQDVARALGDAKAANATLDHQVDGEPRADQQRDGQQQEQRDHARREGHRRGLQTGRLNRVDQGDRTDGHHGRGDHALDDRLVLTLADKRPDALVHTKQAERDKRAGDHPRDRRLEQILVPGWDPILESQPKS